jgi:hypothetical protein
MEVSDVEEIIEVDEEVDKIQNIVFEPGDRSYF